MVTGPLTVRVPTLLPGARVPLTLTGAAIDPVPARTAPGLTATDVAVQDVLTFNVPAPTVNAPVVLAPAPPRTSTPGPPLVTALDPPATSPKTTVPTPPPLLATLIVGAPARVTGPPFNVYDATFETPAPPMTFSVWPPIVRLPIEPLVVPATSMVELEATSTAFARLTGVASVLETISTAKMPLLLLPRIAVTVCELPARLLNRA